PTAAYSPSLHDSLPISILLAMAPMFASPVGSNGVTSSSTRPLVDFEFSSLSSNASECATRRSSMGRDGVGGVIAIQESSASKALDRQGPRLNSSHSPAP